MKIVQSSFCALLLALSWGTLVHASETSGTITAAPAYAWGENIGWMNFAADEGDVAVTDDGMTGYVWTANYGWINLSPGGDFGSVTNDGEGALSGYAWSALLGPISFDGVMISDSGEFSGTGGAADAKAGRISFDCDECSVVTDWRPASVRGSSDPDSGGGGSSGSSHGNSSTGSGDDNASEQGAGEESGAEETGTAPNSGTPSVAPPKAAQTPGMDVQKDDGAENADTPPDLYAPLVPDESDPAIEPILERLGINPISQSDDSHAHAFNEALRMNARQTGTLVQEFAGGYAAVVEVPRGAAGRERGLIISVMARAADTPPSLGGILITIAGGIVFDIIAHDTDQNAVHEFVEPIKITLIVPEMLQGKDDLGIYYLDESAHEWVRVPDAVFGDATASFFVDHLTRFAIFNASELSDRIPASGAGAADQTSGYGWSLLLFALVPAYFIYQARKSKRPDLRDGLA